MKRDFFSKLHTESNQGILTFLKKGWNKYPKPVCCFPEDIKDPYSKLKTHPELVSWLWDTLHAKLSLNCKFILYGKPVLIHPKTFVIFGFGHGETACALRLPYDRIEDALELGMVEDVELKNGQKMYSEDIGDDWVFCGWNEDEVDWCLRSFEYAAKMSKQSLSLP